MNAGSAQASIERMFSESGDQRYTGLHEEPVTALEHALQCARLARRSGASQALVLAALLHDIGHFLPRTAFESGEPDDQHELSGAQWLMQWFPEEVTEPIRLHVSAKRYLCSAKPDYHGRLSPASLHSLSLQGGVYSQAQAQIFIQQPHATEAVQLRIWDDHAKHPGLCADRLADFLDDVPKVIAQVGQSTTLQRHNTAL